MDAWVERALAAIDEVHREDPDREDGRPAELVYAERMSAVLTALEPAPSGELRVAVRAAHLARWETPRSAYPATRAGYLRWREMAKRKGAERAAAVLRASGCSAAVVDRVVALIERRDRARDGEAQRVEDCACLVFIAHQFEAFADGRDASGLARIVARTWGKMSPRAQVHARSLPAWPKIAPVIER